MTSLVLTTDICTYPSAIARAIAALDESPVFRDLPDGYFRVVVRLIKKINLNRLFSPIVASRGTIAKESGKSVETVGRAVKWLEDKKLVTRNQKARAGLRGSSAPLIPTTKLIDALTLRQQNRPMEDSPAPSIEPPFCPIPSLEIATPSAPVAGSGYPQEIVESPVKSDVSKSMNQNQQSLQRQPETPELAQKAEKIGKFRIPGDLVWLIKQNDLAPTGLLALMKQAKKVGQRLSDVVAVAHGYLVKLTGRRLYAYLSTLLRQGKDYSYVRAQQIDEHRMNAAAANEAQRIAMKSMDWVGRRFVTLDGIGSIAVETGGWISVSRPGADGSIVTGSRRLDAEFVRLVDRGALKFLA